MLQSVTWSQYFLVICVATVLYYLFIWIVFFKARLSFLTDIGHFQFPSSTVEDAPDEVMSTVQHVIDEIRLSFSGHSNRSELLMALQQRLSKYKDVDDPVFRDTINQFIAEESERQCSIRLGKDDLRVVWL
jgi:hypothetical protein